jgi:GT2 family glycosyltransferase
MAADVVVVVVTYNSVAVVQGLLDSLPRALGDLTADVVVVDNGSSDATRDVVQARPDCRLVRSTNVGYAGGINLGVRSAEPVGPIVVLNPDVRLHDGAIVRLVAALGNPGVGITAPRVLDPDGSLALSLRREPTLARGLGLAGTGVPLLSEYVTDEDDYARPGPVDWALGAVLAISRECWDTVGGWDESYFLYSEETDFCLRARDLGFATWYEPAAECEHIGGGSGRDDLTHTMQVVNRVRLYRRRHSLPAAWLYFALTILSESSWIVRGQPQSRASIRALLRPRRPPPQLNCSLRLMPE